MNKLQAIILMLFIAIYIIIIDMRCMYRNCCSFLLHFTSFVCIFFSALLIFQLRNLQIFGHSFVYYYVRPSNWWQTYFSGIWVTKLKNSRKPWKHRKRIGFVFFSLTLLSKDFKVLPSSEIRVLLWWRGTSESYVEKVNWTIGNLKSTAGTRERR